MRRVRISGPLVSSHKNKNNHHPNTKTKTATATSKKYIMNALRNTFLRSANQAVRTKATLAGKSSAIPPFKQYNLKQAWFSDPSTYPIIVIMGCALTFMTGMAGNALFNYKDVQIDPRKRTSMMTTWGEEERHGVLKTFNEKVLGGVRPEGLGIDHEAWEKSKKQEGGRFQ